MVGTQQPRKKHEEKTASKYRSRLAHVRAILAFHIGVANGAFGVVTRASAQQANTTISAIPHDQSINQTCMPVRSPIGGNLLHNNVQTANKKPITACKINLTSAELNEGLC